MEGGKKHTRRERRERGRREKRKIRRGEGDATWVVLEVETLRSPRDRDRLLVEGKVPVGPWRMGRVSVIGIGRVPTGRQGTAVSFSWMLKCEASERQETGGGCKRRCICALCCVVCIHF